MGETMDARAEEHVGNLNSIRTASSNPQIFWFLSSLIPNMTHWILGLKWSDEMPAEKYLYAETEGKPDGTLKTDDLTWHHLDEADPHILALLQWVFDYYVRVPSFVDKTICCYEQLVFQVVDAKWEAMDGCKWGLQLQVYSFWSHVNLTYYFRLEMEDDPWRFATRAKKREFKAI